MVCTVAGRISPEEAPVRELWPGGSGDDGGVIDIASDGEEGVAGSGVGRDYLDLCRTSVAHLESIVSGQAHGHNSVTTLLQPQSAFVISNWFCSQIWEDFFSLALLAVPRICTVHNAWLSQYQLVKGNTDQ